MLGIVGEVKNELISSVLQWTHQGWLTSKTYIQQLCADTRYPLEDLTSRMADKDGKEDGES